MLGFEEHLMELSAFKREIWKAVESGKISTVAEVELLEKSKAMSTEELWKAKTGLRDSCQINCCS